MEFQDREEFDPRFPRRLSGGGVSRRDREGIIGSLLTARKRPSAGAIISAVNEGLSIQELEILRESLALPMDQLAPRLGLSKATLHRRKLQGRLDSAESDRVIRFAGLLRRAVEALDTEENARLWLSSPQHGLGGAVPLDYAGTEVGAREVEDLLGRIEYGVYS